MPKCSSCGVESNDIQECIRYWCSATVCPDCRDTFKACPECSQERARIKNQNRIGSGYPYLSEGLGCPPQQAQAFADAYAKMGVPTEITPGGEAVIRDRAHRKQLLRVAKMHDRNSYNGH